MVQRRRNSHIEGLATHDDPESCRDAREGMAEALTGVHAGRVFAVARGEYGESDLEGERAHVHDEIINQLKEQLENLTKGKETKGQE